MDEKSTTCVEFPSLQSLHIQFSPGLKTFIFHDKVLYPSICRIKLLAVENLRWIWHPKIISSGENMTKLLEVEIYSCGSVEYIFPTFLVGNLLLLQKLSISKCGIKEIVGGGVEGPAMEFPSLEYLKMEECPNLGFIFNVEGSFPNLYEIELFSLKKLKKIWQSKVISNAEYMKKLCKVKIQYCENLEYVFPTSLVGNFSQLEVLHLIDCGVKEIAAGEGVEGTVVKIEFSKLKELEVIGCEEIVDLFYFEKHDANDPTLQETQKFSYLEIIKLDESQLRSTCPSSFSEFVNHFPRLKYLEVSGIYSDARLHIVLGKFHILEELKVNGCSNGEIFSSTKVGKQAGGFAVLKEVPPLSSFKNLKILKVYSCYKMMNLMTASTAKSFVVLEEMIIENCYKVTQIIKGEEDAKDEITFYRLKRLELKSLGNFLSFYDGKCTFNFPWLEKLVVVECPTLMLSCSGTFSMPNFQQLELGEKGFENKTTIHKCKNHEINRLIGSNLISSSLNQSSTSWSQLKLIQKYFPEHIKDLSNLRQLDLNGNDIEMCQNQFSEFIFSELRCFCISNDDSITFPNKIFGMFKYGDKLERLELWNCSYEEIFSYEEVENALFPLQIKFLTLNSLHDLKGIWGRDYKQDLLQNFESLDVIYCNSLNSLQLPLLSFGNLKKIKVFHCDGLVSLMVASTARSLEQLEELELSRCHKIRQVVTDDEADGAKHKKITFRKLKNLNLHRLSSLTSFVEGNCLLEFPVLEQLDIQDCPNMNHFTLGSLRTPRLRELSHDYKKYPCKDNDVDEIIKQYHEAMIFYRNKLAFKSIKCMLQTKEVFDNLRKLSFRGDEMLLLQSQLPQLQQVFPYLLCFKVFEDESTSPFPLSILHTFQTVVELELHSCSYEEIFSSEDLDKYAVSFARIKKLSVYGFQNLKQLWEHDSILQSNIEQLIVKSCGSLVTLLPPSSSLQNLTRLRVEDCDSLVNLFKPTTAQCLVKLWNLEIKNCKMMETVLSSPEEVVRDGEIIFHVLRTLSLYNLSSLTSFCSQNYILTFPYLNWFTLKRCPRMTLFSPGILDAPKLLEVSHGRRPLDCYNNLNTIVQQIHEKEKRYVDSDPSKSFSQ